MEYDEDDEYDELHDPVPCWKCGGEGFEIICVDDLCHGAGHCMHGDGEAMCPLCKGDGYL